MSQAPLLHLVSGILYNEKTQLKKILFVKIACGVSLPGDVDGDSDGGDGIGDQDVHRLALKRSN